MPYGTIKVDNITFTDGGVDKSVAISGLVQNPTFTGSVTVTGTVSGATVRATTVSGVTISGTTVNAASGVFTTQISGAVVVAPAGTVSAPSVQVGTGASIAPGFYGAGTDQLGVSTGGSSRLIIDSVGQIRVVTLGSAAAPALVVGNDINTGIYSPGADQVAISTNGIGRLFVDSSGNVGIGTSSPAQPLQVAGNVRIGLTTVGTQYSTLSVLGDAAVMSSAPLFNFTTADGSTRFAYIYHGGSGGNFEILNQQSGALTFGANNTERARITSAGLVGIGTSVPTARLHISNGYLGVQYNSGATFPAYNTYFGALGSNFSNGGSEFDIWNTVGQGFAFRSQTGASAQSCLMYIDGTGKVGIGASNPGYALDVVSADTTAGIGYALRLRQNATAAAAAIQFTDTGAATQYGYIASDSSSNLKFATGLFERACIDSSGKVGIGSSAPLEFVDIRRPNGAGNLAVRLVHEGQVEYKIGIKDSDDKLYITNNNGNTALGATTGIIVTSAGSVGIGTSAPSVPLEVNGSIYSKLSTSGDATLAAFNSVASFFILQRSDKAELYTGASQPIVFTNNNVERARIDSSGRLLVGTSTYVQGNTYTTGNLLNVSGGSGVGPQLSTYSADAFALGIDFSKSRSASVGTGTIVQSGDALGNILFNGHDGTGYKQAATITAVVDGTPGYNDMPGRLVFSTTDDGASSPTERMRITNGGDVRIGTAAALDVGSGTDDGFRFLAPGTAAGIFQCSNNDAVGYFRRRSSDGIILSFRRDTTQVGTISVTTTATAYNTFSDYRLKENITPVTNGITRLQQLKPSRFNFIADPTKTVDGFIAHEVQSVVPEAITGEKDAVDADGNPEYQGIDQSKLVPLLTAALQEAIAKIETLEARLTALESA